MYKISLLWVAKDWRDIFKKRSRVGVPSSDKVKTNEPA
jgi:hypothetical protein